MATLASASPPDSPSFNRRRAGWARRCERTCCNIVRYLPLGFVYGLTTWAVYVQTTTGMNPEPKGSLASKLYPLGVLFYIMLNWSYTTAVFTNPGSSLDTKKGYSSLPTSETPHEYTSFTVKSTGEIRYCKKCQCKKPDRAHHCSTCGQCVLKMDHHCPWLAACLGLHNYKPFLLFLMYVSLFCWICFAVSASWVAYEMFGAGSFDETLAPVNRILLSVLSGIIGLVITGFTAWHVYLATRNQTTIESLEKVRYLSPLRQAMKQQLNNRNYIDQGRPSFGDQIREIHANIVPGVTRPEEGEERSSPAQASLRRNWDDIERQRERDRYSEYLDEQDSDRLPNAFDLGWKRNLQHVFGPTPWLWFLPICNTPGDGWMWEPNPKWIEARERMAREREEQMRMQKERERAAGWGPDSPPAHHSQQNGRPNGHVDDTPSRPWDPRRGDSQYLTTSNGVAQVPAQGRRSPRKADQILGRSLGMYSDGETGTPLRTLDRRKLYPEDEGDDYDTSSDEQEEQKKPLNRPPVRGGGSASAANWNDLPDEMIGGGRRSPAVRRSPSRNQRRPDDDGWQDWK